MKITDVIILIGENLSTVVFCILLGARLYKKYYCADTCKGSEDTAVLFNESHQPLFAKRRGCLRTLYHEF